MLTKLNTSLCRDMPPSMFVTLVLGVLSPGHVGRIALASGGHPEPILMRAAGAPGPVRVGGMILGVFEETDFEQVEIDLEPGDSLVLLTDGLIEAPESGGKRPGLPRVLDALVRARELTAQRQAEALTADVLERGTAQVHDDMTTFILKRP